jgi:hypothetical protein
MGYTPVSVTNPDGDSTILDVAYTFSTCGTGPATFELWGPQLIGRRHLTTTRRTTTCGSMKAPTHAGQLCPGLIDPGVRPSLDNADHRGSSAYPRRRSYGDAKDSVLNGCRRIQVRNCMHAAAMKYMDDRAESPFQASLGIHRRSAVPAIIGATRILTSSFSDREQVLVRGFGNRYRSRC